MAKPGKREDDDKINARPTKRLVVHVITRDIRLEDAILDLVDNAIDGARRIAPGSSLKKYWVKIWVGKDMFEIKDNCGGMSRDMARNYAFRFGRPEDYAPNPDDLLPHSIGNFGIGMKRALLKMGSDITVESQTADEYFKVNIDVKDWMDDDSGEDAWTFKFAEQREGKVAADAIGTSIVVRKLYRGVAERFALDSFLTDCQLLIRNKESVAMAAGMSIMLNDTPIELIELNLLQSPSIKPIYRKARHGSVDVRLYAGVGEHKNDEAGWTVVCNGRTILRNDKSAVTGWGYEENGDKIPAYHNQYARFRGYLFFDSDKPDDLPWNTTKTGVDEEHGLYRRYYNEMVAAMKAVFGFLKDVDGEKDADKRPLEAALEKAAPVALSEVTQRSAFGRPKASAAASAASLLTWIRYQRKSKDVKWVKRKLGVAGPREVGEQTFDIYFNSEKGK